MARIPFAFLLLLTVLATLASATVPSFCKCTCFQNSTIIPLGPQHDNNNQPAPPPKPSSTTAATPDQQHQQQQQPRSPNPNPNSFHHHLSSLLTAREASSSCKQCNRAFCLKYNLPICKDAEDKDIKTSCFQRDSHKDQVIVWGFLLGTAGLLGWAGARRVVARVREKRGRMTQQTQAGEGRFGGGSRHDDRGMGGVGRGLGLFSGRGAEDRGAYSPLEEQHGSGAVRGPG